MATFSFDEAENNLDTDMKKIYNKIRSSRKASIIAVAIILVAGIALAQTGGDGEVEENEQKAASTPAVVDTYDIEVVRGGGSYSTDGVVESQAQASLTAESGGVVRQVYVGIGDRVSAGQLLVALSADDERASLAQAEAGLMSQQARLSELQSGARPAELANSVLSVDTAETNLNAARKNYLNTDLKAYLEDEGINTNRGSLEQPVISGVYEGEEEGEYKIDLYRSGAQSGYSFRYSGLETGVSRVSTEIPQPLGDRGLYIQFPDNFAETLDLEWIVPIPNTRSSQFAQARSNLQQAEQSLTRAENNLSLTTEGPRSEQIAAQQAAVAQASAGVQAAQARLDKKVIRAPFAGVVSELDADVGELVSPGTTLVGLVNTDELMVTSYLSSAAAASVSPGDAARVGSEFDGEVAAVSPSINSDTGTVEIVLRVLDENASLLVGDYVSVEIMAAPSSEAGIPVPLSAVRNDTQGAYVLGISDGVATRVAVETGSVRGENVVVTTGLSGISEIITDARGVSIGDEVIKQQ